MAEPLIICGNDPRALLNAPLHGAAEVVIDLYETVDEGDRDAAELLTEEALAFLDFSGLTVTLRRPPAQPGGGRGWPVGRGYSPACACAGLLPPVSRPEYAPCYTGTHPP